MKLQEIIERGYQLRAWTISRDRGEPRVTVKLSKKTSHGEKFYVVHSPQVGAVLKDVEFTEPILLITRR